MSVERRKWSRRASIVLYAIAMVLPFNVLAQGFQHVNLGLRKPTGVNNNDQVVGNEIESGKGFVWDINTGFTDLIVGHAAGINDAGQVAITNEDFEAFRWDQTSGYVPIGTLGGTWSWANGINEKGQVVGISETASGQTHAFLWDSSLGMNDLGVLTSDIESEAYGANGINGGDETQIVGFSVTDTGNRRAFVWDSTNGMTNLDPYIPYTYSEAKAINESGQIIGAAGAVSGVNAFVWDTVNGFVNLGEATAESINDFGDVAGYTDTYAFVWDKDQGMRDLNDLLPENSGWDLLEAYAINENRFVVGTGMYEGAQQAFMMDSTPEPISLCLLGLGGLALIRRKR